MPPVPAISGLALGKSFYSLKLSSQMCQSGEWMGWSLSLPSRRRSFFTRYGHLETPSPDRKSRTGSVFWGPTDPGADSSAGRHRHLDGSLVEGSPGSPAPPTLPATSCPSLVAFTLHGVRRFKKFKRLVIEAFCFCFLKHFSL